MPRFLSLFSSSSSFPPLPPLPSSQRNSIENRELDHLKYARNANDCSPGLIDAAHNFLSHKGNVRPGIHEYLGSGYRECQRVIFINNSRSLPISRSDILRPAVYLTSFFLPFQTPEHGVVFSPSLRFSSQYPLRVYGRFNRESKKVGGECHFAK